MSYFGIPIRNGVAVGLGSIIPLLSGGRLAPSLSLNFLSGSLDSRITFTRASTGTYFDSAGVLQTAAIDSPRFDYNPSTLVAQGLLIEEARTNRVLNSAALATQNVTVTAVAHTLSFYGAGTVVLSGAFTGTLVGSGAFPTRSTLTFTPTAGVLILTVTGSVTQAQLEVGAFATSYIPTTTATVTRAADLAAISTLSPWYSAVEGTLCAKYTIFYANQINGAVALSDGTNNNRMIIRASNASTQTAFTGVAATATVWSGVVNSALANTVTNSAFAYKLNDIAWARNGGTVGVDLSASIPAVNQLKLGADGLGTFPLNGYLQRITYYPYRLTNSEVQALTA